MKKSLFIAILASVLLTSCGTYSESGAFLGGMVGSAIGGISGGPRGHDIGTLVGVVGGAAVGATIDAKVERNSKAKEVRAYQQGRADERRLQQRRQRRRNTNTANYDNYIYSSSRKYSGSANNARNSKKDNRDFDETNSGNDIIEFTP